MTTNSFVCISPISLNKSAGWIEANNGVDFTELSSRFGEMEALWKKCVEKILILRQPNIRLCKKFASFRMEKNNVMNIVGCCVRHND